MKHMAALAIGAKARSMYGRHLQAKDYDELIHKRSVGEIAAYLKNETDYKQALKDIHENSIHRGQLEELLRRDLFSRTISLMRYATPSSKAFYRLYLLQLEINIILSRIRTIISKRYDEGLMDVPFYIRSYASFDLHRLSNATKMEQLIELLEKTPYAEVLKPYVVREHEIIDYNGCEHALMTYYYDTVFEVIEKSFKGKMKKELLDLYAIRIELENICKIYRYKKYYNDPAFDLKGQLYERRSRLSKTLMESLLAAPKAEDVLKLLAESKYKLYIGSDDYVYIEYYTNEIRYHLAHRYMHFSTSAPMIFTAYLFIQEMEIANLVSIIEGVRYGVPYTDISKILIY